jgi:hypothetical protein
VDAISKTVALELDAGTPFTAVVGRGSWAFPSVGLARVTALAENTLLRKLILVPCGIEEPGAQTALQSEV